MRHSWVLAVVAVSGVERAAAAPDEIMLATITQQDPNVHDPALDVTCGPEPKNWIPDAGPARFTVSKTGMIVVDESAPADTIAFTGTTNAIAVLERPGDAVLACDRIVNGTYRIPSDAKAKDVLQLRVFDSVEEPAKQRVRAFRRDKVAELQKRELAALRAEPALIAFAAAARTAVLAPTPELIRRLDGAFVQLELQLAQLRADFGCDATVPNGLLAPTVCAEAFSVGHLARSIRQSVDDVGSKPLGQQQHELRAAKVSDEIAALGAEQLPVVVDERAHCEALDELNWLSVEDMSRVVHRSQLPIVDVVYGATYGARRAPVKDLVLHDRTFALVVSSVPVGDKTAFRERQGDRTSLDPMAMVAAFLKVTLATSWPATTTRFAALGQSRSNLQANLVGIQAEMARQQLARARFDGLKSLSAAQQKDKLLLDAEIAELVENERRIQQELTQKSAELDQVEQDRIVAAPVATPSLICHRGNTAADDRELRRFKVDAALPPTTGIENLAHVIEEVKRDHELSVVLCNGTCGAAADEKTDRAKLSITPSTRYSFTLLAELAVGRAHDGGIAGLSPPELVPVLGADGPDQVFELAQTADPRNVFSTSLLLAFRLPRRFVVGVGPTLLVGTSGAVFQQWNARLGVKLGHGIYLTAGPSVRAMQFANDYAIGDRVSVPRPASGSASAPTFAKHYEAVLEWQAGFSFDLEAVGGIGSDIYKALGGK